MDPININTNINTNGYTTPRSITTLEIPNAPKKARYVHIIPPPCKRVTLFKSPTPY